MNRHFRQRFDITSMSRRKCPKITPLADYGDQLAFLFGKQFAQWFIFIFVPGDWIGKEQFRINQTEAILV